MKSLLPYQILVFITHRETWKAHTIKINVKYLHQHGMMNLNYWMDCILCQILKIISNTFLKKHGKNTNKPSVQIYINKIEKRITFKIKDGYSLELLAPETMKLLGSTENKITKNKN